MDVAGSVEEIQAVQKVEEFVRSWNCSYKLSLSVENNSGIVNATFSKPTDLKPAPTVVVKVKFSLIDNEVFKFKIENERHEYLVADKAVYDDAILDRVFKQKTKLISKPIVELEDVYSRNRVPALESKNDTQVSDAVPGKVGSN